jgi:hypothetical protein
MWKLRNIEKVQRLVIELQQYYDISAQHLSFTRLHVCGFDSTKAQVASKAEDIVRTKFTNLDSTCSCSWLLWSFNLPIRVIQQLSFITLLLSGLASCLYLVHCFRFINYGIQLKRFQLQPIGCRLTRSCLKHLGGHHQPCKLRYGSYARA